MARDQETLGALQLDGEQLRRELLASLAREREQENKARDADTKRQLADERLKMQLERERGREADFTARELGLSNVLRSHEARVDELEAGLEKALAERNEIAGALAGEKLVREALEDDREDHDTRTRRQAFVVTAVILASAIAGLYYFAARPAPKASVPATADRRGPGPWPK